MRQPANLGFVGNMNAAFAATAPADVVILNSDCVVAEGWFDGPARRRPRRPDDRHRDRADQQRHARVRPPPQRPAARRCPRTSRSTTPRAASASARCACARACRPRSGTASTPGATRSSSSAASTRPSRPAYGEEVDWSQRCLLHGLQHVAADDVLVLHQGHASLGVEGERNPLQDAHDKIVESRYPHYLPATHDAKVETRSPLARALGVAEPRAARPAR